MHTQFSSALIAASFLLMSDANSWAAPVPADIAMAVADPARPKTQVDTDIDRKPGDTLTFAGVKKGMVVGEFFPGGGYFTQMLSKVVGPLGHVYGIENTGWKGAVEADRKVVVEMKLTNVSIEGVPFGTVSFPKPLDLVWVTQNYHDLKITKFGQVDTAAFNRAVFAALKPGGTYFIVDHEAPKGTDTAGIQSLHRIEKSQVIREVSAAGFVLSAESSILHHTNDDLTVPIFDKKVQGHTDQYALKFIKPVSS